METAEILERLDGIRSGVMIGTDTAKTAALAADRIRELRDQLIDLNTPTAAVYPQTRFKLGDNIVHPKDGFRTPGMKILAVQFGMDGDVGYVLSAWNGLEQCWRRHTVNECEISDWVVTDA